MSFKTLSLAGLALVASSVLVSAAGHTSAPAVTGEHKGAHFLMDAHKMTLYTFDKDQKGKSNCYEDCAVK